MKRLILPVLSLLAALAAMMWFRDDAVDFNTQVKPIFNRKCVSCHGGVRKKANLGLLFRQEALAPAESGKAAIIPGNADDSELIRRITASDPEERMPYRHEPLSQDEITILRDWINQGAEWGNHWAYTAVEPVAPPQPSWYDFSSSNWIRNDIDRFVYAKIKEHDLTPSPQANRRTLLRRVSLDLTGLPPDEKLTREFLADSSDASYEKLVDALLASPQFGERWAAVWMDLARYADTKGYERDYVRSIWRYRDWLINAFNNDMPYDQFITEQLAGDLLDNPSDDQLLATAFHRNTMTNDEGGSDNEEFRTAAVLDRVNTTWEALMGTTFACTQCHGHPYDPFRHEEYYKFVAFFNNTRDEDTYDDYPLLREFKRAEDTVELNRIVKWADTSGKEIFHFVKTGQPAYNSLNAICDANSSISDTKWLIFRNHAAAHLNGIELTGKSEVWLRLMTWVPQGTIVVRIDHEKGPELTRISPPLTKGQWTIISAPIKQFDGRHDLWFSYESPSLKNATDNGVMFDWFYFTNAFEARPGADQARAAFKKLLETESIRTPIMMENPSYQARATHVFKRGNWLDPGDEVQPGTPASLHPFPKEAPLNRLGLASWVISKDNPLTSRTFVNRVWEQLFGTGLVETLEDMGTQGMTPSHPELLNHLSWELMNTDKWSLKQMLKKIVMSATYRQDSKVLPEHLEKDPSNRYLARAPRVRLSAEQVRDQALAVSGLLSRKMFGPGVKPYQPEGIWQSPYNGLKWVRDKNEDQYRRAVYTYWKRTSPYPSMLIFDGNTREVCSARRIRTNTPLQALVTLNDSVYVEAAESLSKWMEQSSPDTRKQIAMGYERVVGRPISDARLTILNDLYIRSAGNNSRKTSKDQIVSPMMIVANTLLNLDEFLTKY